MDVPAWAFSNLCIGRTYDANNNRAGIDIFLRDIPTKTENVNTFSFRYKIVKTNEDVRDLLNISGNISLKIKANILKVEGAGKYINFRGKDEGITEVLAVMKCSTVHTTMDGSAKPKEDVLHLPYLGTHYVRSVTYGAEMIASLKFKSVSSSTRLNLTGKSDGGLDFQGVVGAGLEAQLKKLSSECSKASDLSIEYYATDLPDKNPTNLEDLVTLIQEFPSRLKNINEGKGVPIKIELQPLENIPNLLEPNPSPKPQVLDSDVEEIERRFDDLCHTKDLVAQYRETVEDLDEDMKKFNSDITKALRAFRAAIASLDTEKVDKCLEMYEEALDGNDDEEKFARHWRNMLKKKTPSTSIKLPTGDELTVVLLGKTGNGKSATGNRIVGTNHFESYAYASSVTSQCQYGSRTSERQINVIDTPGVLDTSSVKLLKNKMKELLKDHRKQQEKVLTEVFKIFALAPQGFHAVTLVVKYGSRFTNEDEQALQLLQNFMGTEANEYIILILTYGDQAKFHAQEHNISLAEWMKKWVKTLPQWVQNFIKEIKDRVVLFDNRLKEDSDPEGCKKQLSELIEVIDKMTQGKKPFIHKLNKASRKVLDERIKYALDSSGFTVEIDKLENKKEALQIKLKDENISQEERKKIELSLQKLNEEVDEKNTFKKDLEDKTRQSQVQEAQEESGGEATAKIAKAAIGGGCFPESADFVDAYGRRKRMDSLQIGVRVQVVVNERICLEPVIAFIHRQPDVLQDFLNITTATGRNVKITEDHLLFVERMCQATALPARDVKIGDTIYVREKDVMATDTVQDISFVIEKGVYAPVTLSGTILVNDVHTSCYFDVLSHEWSHRAMSVARAVHYVSPWILQWISGVGQKDGFPGWCRLAHKMLTL